MSAKTQRPLDTRTEKLVGKMHTYLEKQLDLSARQLRYAAERQIKYDRKISGAKIPAPKARKRIEIPPAVVFAKPDGKPKRGPIFSTHLPAYDAHPDLEILPLSCVTTYVPPPYPTGSPLDPVIVPGEPASAGVVAFAQAFPDIGELEVMAATYAGDPTATRSATEVFKTVAAHLIAVYPVPAYPGFDAVRISASVRSIGSSYILGPIFTPEPLTGYGIVSHHVRLSAYVASTDSFDTRRRAVHCRVAGPPPFGGFDSLNLREIDKTTSLSTSVSVNPWDIVVITVSAELVVGVSLDANLYVNGNFSSLNNPVQGDGRIRVPFVSVRYCQSAA